MTATAAFPPPSAEGQAEAMRRARALATGLFPHQVEGVAFLLGRRRAILADDMGLGKTRQSIVAMLEAAPNGPYLVVVPASVKWNWEREIRTVRPDARICIVGPGECPDRGYAGWVIVNYDILGKHLDKLGKHLWKGMVFDEAHYLKNHQSQRSQLVRKLVEGAPEAVLYALTGTPVTNRPRDLFPLLQLVGHPMGRSFLSFAKRYCAAYHNGFGWVTDGASKLEDLSIQLAGLMLRRNKAEVLNLPPKLRTWIPVAVPEGTGRRETRKVLEMLLVGQLKRTSRRSTDDDATRGRLLAEITKARKLIAAAKVKTTIEFLEGVVAQGEKVLVFSCFDEPVQKIADHFGDQAVRLTGATPAGSRQKLVDRFQTDPEVRVFVANIIAGGVGLNLTAARQVVFNDLDWVPANHWQAEDRAYRIGQTETVNVTYMSAQGTVDEFVSNALTVKSALVEAVVDGRGAGETGGDLLKDLAALIGTLSPELADLDEASAGEDPVDRLLREVTAAMAARRSPEADSRLAALQALPEEALLALARVLMGPAASRYEARSSSDPGKSYTLDVEGGTVSCTCRGFEYRGTCSHARTLGQALAAGGALPEGFAPGQTTVKGS